VFPPGTKSLVSKFLTRHTWDRYKNSIDTHCDNFSFADAIFSGCKNVDSGIGIYAGSLESYFKFPDIFTPIIQQYHGP